MTAGPPARPPDRPVEHSPGMNPPSALVPIFRVFGHRQYALFMGGMGPGLVTLWMQRVGIGWLVWQLTHSPVWLGIIAATELAPVILIAPLAGALTDRSDPLRQEKITQFLQTCQALALGISAVTGWINIWVVFGLVLFNGVVQPFATTARYAIVPSTVPRDDYATAVALDSTLFNGSRFVGPAIAGIAIPFGGVACTFFANAVTGVFFLLLLFMMELVTPDRAPSKGRHILGDVAEGLAYVRTHAGIGPLFVLMAMIAVFIRPMQDMLPGFSGEVFHAGAQGLAWLTSSLGVGAMFSAGMIAMRGRITGLTRMITLACCSLGLALLGFVATPHLWIAIAFGALSGFSLNTMSTSTQALTQSALTDELRGRVMGLYTMIYRGVPAVGSLVIGLSAEHFGLRPTFVGSAVVCLVTWVWLLTRRRTMAHALETEHPVRGDKAPAGTAAQ